MMRRALGCLTWLPILSAAALSAQAPCREGAQIDAAWAAYRQHDLSSARAGFEDVLSRCPTEPGSAVGLAYVELRQANLQRARALLERVLKSNPGHGDALKALARLEAREGRLAESSGAWTQVLARDPDDVEALVGRAQTLRWQGEAAKARPLLDRAMRLAPTDPDVRTELDWSRAAVGPQAQTRITYEQDSDDNRIVTLLAGGGLELGSGVRVRWESYLRRTAFGDNRDRQAAAHRLSATVRLPSGWRVGGGLGASESSVLGQPVATDLDLALSSPSAGPWQGALRLSRSPRNYTSTLIERGVRADEVSVEGTRTGSTWSTSIAADLARLRGTDVSDRWGLRGSFLRQWSTRWQTGLAARGFGFSNDVRDGYFDPRYFVLLELPVRAQVSHGAWSGMAELAGGVQQSATQDSPGFAPRTSLEGRYRLAPGREFSLSTSWARSDALRLSGGSGSYRYTSIALAGGWVF